MSLDSGEAAGGVRQNALRLRGLARPQRLLPGDPSLRLKNGCAQDEKISVAAVARYSAHSWCSPTLH
jgi:hypothetical protein